MAVAEATGDADKMIEEVLMEQLLDAVSPELRAWLKEQKPKTAEELVKLANLHVQSGKGPLVDGKHVSTGVNEESGKKKTPDDKMDDSLSTRKQDQKLKTPKPPSPPACRTTKSEIKCYKCGKPGHMSFNCGKGRVRPSQGYLLCVTPLTSEQSEFPPCNVRGKINGKIAEMVIDSGCTGTLVHKRYVSNTAFTGDKITVLTAAGECFIVPLANIQFDSKEGTHVELVGVLDRLPVDCLLGRSSFGQTLSRPVGEKCLADHAGGDQAFVMTRRQKVLEEAQLKADELIDRENSLAVKSLSKKETKPEGPEEGDLQMLFEGTLKEEAGKKNLESDALATEPGRDKLPVNILDRDRNQLIAFLMRYCMTRVPIS